MTLRGAGELDALPPLPDEDEEEEAEDADDEEFIEKFGAVKVFVCAIVDLSVSITLREACSLDAFAMLY